MKIEELKKALKSLIREEVNKAVAEEVNKAMGKVLVEMVKEIKSTNNKATLNESVVEEAPPIIHTKNPKLNSVLAETARRGKNFPRPDSTGLAELMGGGFDKVGGGENVGVAQPSSNMDFLKQMVGSSGTPNVPSGPQTPSVLDYQDELPESLQSVFKTDFRSKMKKMDEIKRTGGSGLIMPSQVLAG